MWCLLNYQSGKYPPIWGLFKPKMLKGIWILCPTFIMPSIFEKPYKWEVHME